ncbi:MAG: hypothetical protein KC550_04530, partial [Nanoarchaeota archaeon]|nr:hypothetical protein [Nanoarchaeota archaeon]
NLVLSMGSQNNRINLSKAAKIRIPAMAGKSTAWSLNSSSLTKITTICNSISNPSNIDPVSVQECYIDDGLDLLIWTFHFTDFAAYTPDPVVTPPPDDDDDDDDNSGSSGSSSSSSTTNSVIYYVDEEENENENDTILETSLENSIENEKKYITWPRIDYQKLNTSNDFLEFNYLNMDNTLKLKGILYSSKILTMTFKDRSEEVFTLNEGTNLLLDSNNNGENDLKVWFKFVDSKNVRVYMSPLFKNVDEELALINLNKASEELSENNQNMEKLNSIEETSNIQTTSENTDTSETKTENMEEEKTSWGVYVLTSILILIILYFPITYIRWRIYLKGEETNEIDLDTPQTVNHLKKHIVNHVIDEVIINKNLQNKDNHPMDKYIKKRSEQIEELNLNDSDYIDDYSDK